MEKRISSRGVIIDGDAVYLMYRRKLQENGKMREYYVIPGGGLEGNETLEENVIRELKEEFTIDVKPLNYLGFEEDDSSIIHFFKCQNLGGTPKLGGEELERCCETNYYEVKKVKLSELDSIDVYFKEYIKKAILY